MKKFNLFFIILILAGFLLIPFKNAFAQNQPLFSDKLYLKFDYQLTSPSDQMFPMDNLTQIIVRKQSFSEPVTLKIYKGIWKNIKDFAPTEYSPISFYRIFFTDKNNTVVFPKYPIIVQFNASSVSGNINFYPILNNGIDKGIQKSLVSGSYNRDLLAINDEGLLIVTDGKIPPITEFGSINGLPDAQGVPSSPYINRGAQNLQNNTLGTFSLLPILVLLLIILIALLLIIFKILKRRKRNIPINNTL